MIDEKLLKRIEKRQRNRIKHNHKMRDYYAIEKRNGIRCQVGDCNRKTKIRVDGGWYCLRHGQKIAYDYGMEHGLCTKCGVGERREGFQSCESCAAALRHNAMRWRKGLSNSVPAAINLLKRYGEEILG